jgi:P2X purinoceptor 4
VSVFFEYDTPKIVHIKSKKIGILSRLVQSCVLAYVIGYVLVYNKGYQEVDEVVGAVTSKAKGGKDFCTRLFTSVADPNLDPDP